ncbi:MAG: hypothetical protein KBT68_10035 [bacterium]|nr:hypothetical protein [Candidatus Colisoma equi]
MKKLLIAFSMAGAVALVTCAGTGAQSNSVTTNYASQAWFSASVNGTTITTVGGSFLPEVTATGSKIEIDSDIDEPVSFVIGEDYVKTTSLAKVTFKLEASVVPVSALPQPTDLTSAEAPVALVEDQGKTATNFQAWVASGWKTLSGFTIPTVDQSYDLTMKFNDLDSTKKVQFVVKIGQNDEQFSDWYTYAGLTTNPQIDFIGTGKLTGMAADQVAIVSAEINFTGGKVTIAEKDAVAMGKLVTGTETIETVLATPVSEKVSDIDSSCTLSTAEAYAIGLIAKDANDTMVAAADGTFKVKADAQANVSGGIPVGFVTPLTPNDSSATVTYKLMGSQTGAADSYKTEIVAATPDLSTIKIPTGKVGVGDGQCRYFKIVTTVTLKEAPKN